MQLRNRNMKNRKIAVLMADGFEMAEYTVPVNALRLAGASITVISLRRGRIRGVNLHEPAHRVHADLTIDKAPEVNFDALFVPGGFINPDLLRQSELVRKFVSAFDRAKKPIATLCHGPWVLASSGLLKGRALTSWPGIRDDVVNAGGTWLDQPVVRDGNLLTSRGPQDFAQFVPALLAFFGEPASEMASRPSSAQSHSSPQRAEAPSVVLGTMKWMPRPSLRGFALGVVVGGLSMLVQRACNRSSEGMRIPIESAVG
jgi:protease I